MEGLGPGFIHVSHRFRGSEEFGGWIYILFSIVGIVVYDEKSIKCLQGEAENG